ncbi:hypothetical protein HPP92_011075 [Vanilla planifolia]|uniref:Uncharacterized protein n=1 Tax=Vanilla planifolia TaxID=51239 RepID=A0A835R026_VANPL|nr:hypothetical protein HPP92_011075 [Vanilla planifolia]
MRTRSGKKYEMETSQLDQIFVTLQDLLTRVENIETKLEEFGNKITQLEHSPSEPPLSEPDIGYPPNHTLRRAHEPFMRRPPENDDDKLIKSIKCDTPTF